MIDRIFALFVPVVFIVVGISYIYNIVWALDHWGALAIGAKILNVLGVFVPPLGGILGVVHFL